MPNQGEVPQDQDHKIIVPVLSTNEVIARLHDNMLRSTHQHVYRAMYSSIVGGVILDPAMMSIPLDDHMVHRGHGVFDTAQVLNGYLYELDIHLDRFLKSATMARVVSPFTLSSLKEIVVQTVAASNCRDGSVRYWLSAGPGGFDLSSKECIQSSFYVVVLEASVTALVEGVNVITSTIPMKPPQFATMKNVNYLPNALSKLEAEDHGAYAGIWVDDEGFVAEGPNINVAFVSRSGVLLIPSFDKILSGCTAKRMLALAPKLLHSENNPGEDASKTEGNSCAGLLKAIHIGQISVSEAKDAAEMMLIGSGLPIQPVVEWDNKLIGDGKVGPVTLALINLVMEDMFNGTTTQHIRVSYRDQKNEA